MKLDGPAAHSVIPKVTSLGIDSLQGSKSE